MIISQNVLCGKHCLYELAAITAFLKGYFKLAPGSSHLLWWLYMCMPNCRDLSITANNVGC